MFITLNITTLTPIASASVAGRDGGEGGVPAHRPERAAQILEEPFGGTPAPGLARQLAYQRDVAEVAQRGRMRLFGRHPRRDPFLHLFGDVEPDLLFQLCVLPAPAPEGV